MTVDCIGEKSIPDNDCRCYVLDPTMSKSVEETRHYAQPCGNGRYVEHKNNTNLTVFIGSLKLNNKQAYDIWRTLNQLFGSKW